jgi:hypothetical protein
MINDIIIDLDENTFKYYDIDKVELIEPDSQGKDDLKKCYVSFPTNNKHQSIVIKSDRIEVKKFFSNQNQGKCNKQRCDYILINQDKTYFIELKTTYRSSDDEDYKCQFIGALCITDYIDSVLVNFYGKKKFFNNKNVKKRYILFYKNPPVSKLTTSLKEVKDESNNKPDKYKIIQVDNDGVVAIEELG